MQRWLPAAALLFLSSVSCDDHIFQSGTVDVDAYEPNWDGVQVLFDDHCTVCHADGGSAFELTAAIEDDLATGAGLYVVAGDAEASGLWQSLTFTGSSDPMPLGNSTPLDADLTAHVEEWILGGAEL